MPPQGTVGDRVGGPSNRRAKECYHEIEDIPMGGAFRLPPYR